MNLRNNGTAPSTLENVTFLTITTISSTYYICALQHAGYTPVGFLSPVPHGRIFVPIVHDRDKFSNRKQSETNRIDENAMCDYISEYLRMSFCLYEDSSRPFLDIVQTFCERSKIIKD